MGNNYVFSLQPTFTQGLILGQMSILVLLALILKYLFILPSDAPIETSSYHPRLDSDSSLHSHHRLPSHDDGEKKDAESAQWFNMLLHQVRFIIYLELRTNTTRLNRLLRCTDPNYGMICLDLKETRLLGEE